MSDDRKQCAEIIQFQIQTSNGHWINWKVAARSMDEQWDMDAVRAVKPKLRFVQEVEGEPEYEFIADENDDMTLKTKLISKETRDKAIREAIHIVADVDVSMAEKLAKTVGLTWPLEGE